MKREAGKLRITSKIFTFYGFAREFLEDIFNTQFYDEIKKIVCQFLGHCKLE